MKAFPARKDRTLPGRVGRLLGMRTDEMLPTALRSVFLFFLMVSFMVSKSLRDATFLDAYGAEQLPRTYILLSVVLAGGALYYNRILRRFGARAVFNGSLGVALVIQTAFFFLYRSGFRWVPVAYYLFVASYGILIAQFWLFLGQSYSIQEAKRLMLPVGAGGIFGAIVGGLLVKQMAESLPVSSLILVAAGSMGMCLLVTPFMGPRFSPGGDAAPGPLRLDSLWMFRKNRYLLKILALTALTAILATFVEFQFNVFVQDRYHTARRMAAFFGSFYLMLSSGALLVQFILARPVLRRAGLFTALNLLPLGLLAGAVALLLAPALWICLALRLWDGVFRHSLYATSREILYLPLSRAEKIRSKIFLDAFAPKASEGVAGGLLLIAVKVFRPPYPGVSAAVALLSGLTLWIGLSMRRDYVTRLKANMESGWPRIEKARIEYSDRTTVSAFMPYLTSLEPEKILTAIRMLKQMNRPDLVFRDLFLHPDGEVKKEVLSLLAEAGENPDPGILREMFRHPDPRLAADAVRVFARFYPISQDEVRFRLLASEHRELQMAAVEVLASHAEQTSRNRAYEILRSLSQRRGEEGIPGRIDAARSIGNIGRREYTGILVRLLEDESPRVVREAMMAAGRGPFLHAVFHLIDNLRDPRLCTDAGKALSLYGARIVGTLYDFLRDEAGDFRSRFQIPRVLREIGGPEVFELLQVCLSTSYPLVRHRIMRILNSMFREDPALRLHRAAILETIEDQLRKHFLLLADRHILRTLSLEREPRVLQPLDEQVDMSLETVFGLLNLAYVRADFSRVLFSMRSRTRTLQDWAKEFVDTEVRRPGSIRAPLRLILDDLPEPEKIARGCRLVPLNPDRKPEEVLESLCGYPDHWLVSCALFSLYELDLGEVFRRVKEEVDTRSRRIRDTLLFVEKKFEERSSTERILTGAKSDDVDH
jgi:ATP:ADP antiporter, AAA family